MDFSPSVGSSLPREARQTFQLASHRRLALSLVLWLYIAALAAYGIHAGATVALGVPELNRPISIAVRGTMIFAALLLIAGVGRTSLRLLHKPLPWLAFGVWLLWFVRWGYTVVADEQLLRDSMEYALFGGTCLIAMIAAMQRLSGLFWQRIQLGLLASLVLALAINGLLFTLPGDIHLRLSHQKLNPITFGHMGASTLLLAAALFFQRESSSTKRVISLVGIAAGTLALLSAASRGPTLAAAVTLAALVVLRPMGLSRRVFFSCALVLLLAGVLAAEPDQFQVLSDRLISTGASGDVSGQERLLAWQETIRSVEEHPFLGAGLELERGYPHNVVLEAFLTTGVLGGIGLLIVLGWTALLAGMVIRVGGASGWVALLYFQYLIASMVSGAFYTQLGLWVTLGGTVSAAYATSRRKW